MTLRFNAIIFAIDIFWRVFMVQVSKRLVVRKEVQIDNPQELITSLDLGMADYYCNSKNFIKGLELYKNIIGQ